MKFLVVSAKAEQQRRALISGDVVEHCSEQLGSAEPQQDCLCRQNVPHSSLVQKPTLLSLLSMNIKIFSFQSFKSLGTSQLVQFGDVDGKRQPRRFLVDCSIQS